MGCNIEERSSICELRATTANAATETDPAYFCQVRFLWRLARSCLRRLCLLIFAFRLFFKDPIKLVSNGRRSIYNFVERILNDSLCARRLELRNQLAHDVFVNDRFHCHPARQA